MVGLSIVLGLARYFMYDDADFSLFSLVDKNKKEIEIDIEHSEKIKKNLEFLSELNSNKEFKEEIETFSNITSKKHISFDDAFFLHSNDLAIFIDARDQDEITKEGQIPNSQNIPVSNIKLIYEGIRNDYNECTDYDAYNWQGEYACGYSDLLDSNFSTKIDSDFEIPRMEMALSDFPIEMKVFNILKNDLDKTSNYVVYCGSSDCDKSEDLYVYMTEFLDFEKVMKFAGGWKVWKKDIESKNVQ
jgi:rhodanese-related sulfurtransferase